MRTGAGKMIAFGPVPSRRLGRSLGINNIPPKVCSYSCLYCQVGRTSRMEVERQAFYLPDVVLGEVAESVSRAREQGVAVDFLTFVPDGEPTLDANLGREIEMLRPLGIRIAVITNASLIWRRDVQEELMKADWVSLKVDSVDEAVWRRVNRPQRQLHLDAILEGARSFSKRYRGELATETMLVGGVNDSEESLEGVADFLAELRPARAFLSVPTRPPAEEGVRPPGAAVLNAAFQILSRRLEQVEYLVEYEGEDFAFLGDLERGLLATTAVHPMSEDAVGRYIAKAGANWDDVQRLVDRGQLAEEVYCGRRFYIRNHSRCQP